MKSILKQLVLVSLVTSCGSSSGGGDGGGGKPPVQEQDQKSKQNDDPNRPVISEIPQGESEVFEFDDKVTFGKGDIQCDSSGYGYALDEKLNKMAVCCVAMDKIVGSGVSKFVTRQADRIVIKPEGCDATVLSGNVNDLALAVDVDLSTQKYVTTAASRKAIDTFEKVTGEVTITGNKSLDTKLVGRNGLSISGKTKISNLHSLGSLIVYSLQDTAGFNNLVMTDVNIEGHNELTGGLALLTGAASSRGTTGMSLKFENVKVVAEKENPVLLGNYPFDTTGIEIVAGKKYPPHIGLQGVYRDTAGVISEKRYPIIPDLALAANSKLTVGPGVKLKLPNSASKKAGFRSNNDSGTFVLDLAGSATEHIVLANVQDDSVGGDTNGDGNATLGALSQLIDGGYNSAPHHGDILVHNTDLLGVGLAAQFDAKLQLGNITLRPAQDNKSWLYPIYMFNTRTAGIFIDASVEAWHPVETYTDNGKLRLSTLIYTGDRGSYGGQTGTAFVKGVDFITIHNSSTSPSKVGEDSRVAVPEKEHCVRVEDKDGKVSAEAKAWTYYVKDNALTQCQ